MSHLDKNLPLASMYNRAKFHPVTPNITALLRAQTNRQIDKQTLHYSMHRQKIKNTQSNKTHTKNKYRDKQAST